MNRKTVVNIATNPDSYIEDGYSVRLNGSVSWLDCPLYAPGTELQREI
jgi:hypothetical protein